MVLMSCRDFALSEGKSLAREARDQRCRVIWWVVAKGLA